MLVLIGTGPKTSNPTNSPDGEACVLAMTCKAGVALRLRGPPHLLRGRSFDPGPMSRHHET
ncbi:MAG: hypothetical protein U1F56_16560 [Rubrivivax sp.]